MELSITKRVTHYVNFYTWGENVGLSQYIQHTLGLEFEPDLFGAKNHKSYTFDVKRPEPGSYIEKNGIEVVNTLREKGQIEVLGSVLNYLAEAFDLPEGIYSVEVSW
jgi:hypothetical protein